MDSDRSSFSQLSDELEYLTAALIDTLYVCKSLNCHKLLGSTKSTPSSTHLTPADTPPPSPARPSSHFLPGDVTHSHPSEKAKKHKKSGESDRMYKSENDILKLFEILNIKNENEAARNAKFTRYSLGSQLDDWNDLNSSTETVLCLSGGSQSSFTSQPNITEGSACFPDNYSDGEDHLPYFGSERSLTSSGESSDLNCNGDHNKRDSDRSDKTIKAENINSSMESMSALDDDEVVMDGSESKNSGKQNREERSVTENAVSEIAKGIMISTSQDDNMNNDIIDESPQHVGMIERGVEANFSEENVYMAAKSLESIYSSNSSLVEPSSQLPPSNRHSPLMGSGLSCSEEDLPYLQHPKINPENLSFRSKTKLFEMLGAAQSPSRSQSSGEVTPQESKPLFSDPSADSPPVHSIYDSSEDETEPFLLPSCLSLPSRLVKRRRTKPSDIVQCPPMLIEEPESVFLSNEKLHVTYRVKTVFNQQSEKNVMSASRRYYCSDCESDKMPLFGCCPTTDLSTPSRGSTGFQLGLSGSNLSLADSYYLQGLL